MKTQMNGDLKLLKHTLDHSKANWEVWCKTIPASTEVQYLLIKQDGTILCDSLDKKSEGQKLPDLWTNLDTEFIRSDLEKSNLFQTKAVVGTLKVQNLMIRKIVPISSFRDDMDRFDRVLFLRIVPFAILSYLVFIFLFYKSTKPLGVILSKVEKFKDDIPFNRSLQLLYKRDEWGSIEEALNKAEQKLQHQVQEAKSENEKNAAILESINDDIIAIDRYETLLFYNLKFKNNFIWNRDGQGIDLKIWHIFSDEVLTAFREVLATGTPQSIKAMNFPQSHSPTRFFDLTITPLKSSNGTITGALGVFYDVTEFKLTEQMRVDFVANVSHEIRTPLTSVKGFTQILQTQSDKVDPSLHPFLNKIITNSERMIALFNDLLNLSVIESKNTIRIEDLSFTHIVEALVGSTDANYPDKKITFETHLEHDQMKGDARLLELVIINLIDNACKYAENSVHIVISSFKKDGKAMITIKDNGPGIEEVHLHRIFERFYRVDFSRETSRGTGLGLSIVKQIISKHRGKISANSEGLGKGTTFTIELPLE